MAKKLQKLKIMDYGDDWLNRLAVILVTLSKMDRRERDATLAFVINKYQDRLAR